MKIDPVLVAIIGEILLVVFVITMAFWTTRRPAGKAH